ncbi:MAG: NUDIX domain-containing protein [Propionibacteriaceae bacterium]|nr:NUDIX domain-containing protein [Propionibacteriaceae bacterium]
MRRRLIDQLIPIVLPFRAEPTRCSPRWRRTHAPHRCSASRSLTRVTSADAPRSFQAVANPADRPRKIRRTVRVILVSENDQTLLFQDSDPGLPEFRWWVIPGGGIDPGETELQAAIREVAEETGLALSAGELLGPIARRHVVHGYSDQVIQQDESFFIARVSRFEVDISAHTEDELLTLQEHRWWDRAAVVETREWIWPARLLELWDLLDDPAAWPLEMGEQEESTLLDQPSG